MKKRRRVSFALMFTSAAVVTCVASCENKSNNEFVPVNEVVSETTAVQDLETTSTETEMSTTTAVTTKTEQTFLTETTAVTYSVDIESIVNKVCETAAVTTTETQVQVIQVTSVVTQYVAQPQTVVQIQVQPVSVQTQPPAQPENLVNSEVEVVNVEKETAIQYQSGIGLQQSYYVQEGDCLWSIASNNGVDVTDIQAINPGVYWDFIQPGDCINLPSYSSSSSSVYYVEAGDCLSIIADKNGYTMDEIIASNPGVDWDYIQPGEVINIPSYTWNSSEVSVAYNSDAPVEFFVEVPVQEPVFVDEVSYVQEPVVVQENETIVAEVVPETVENVTPEATVAEKAEEKDETQNIAETIDSIDEIEEVVHVESIDVYAEETVVLEAADESNAEVEQNVDYATNKEPLDITNYDDAMAIQDHIHKRGYNGGSMDITAGGRVGWMYAKTYSNEYNVLSNIDRAVETLDGYKVPAYGEFSWFEVVGSGYDYLAAETKIDFYDGEPEEAVPIEPGGGVNLPATVLRNAVENLVGSENIIEAYDQTDNGVPEDMRYANVGHEASINYPETDLKFINPYSEPIEITARFNWQNKSCMIDCYCKAAG